MNEIKLTESYDEGFENGYIKGYKDGQLAAENANNELISKLIVATSKEEI